ncbi:RNA polymerase Rpb7 [Trypanosoma melophagium]|uniref:RNA polymerase Rpb7 n=1 Tax=Trypanosoma melophagium TaxID=715481 RepID=UPI00351A7CAB|nr:RNA polymerase Rpb7 [Trypanosoma melophagium]
MFYKLELQKIIKIRPHLLECTLHRHLARYLRNAVEGQPLQMPLVKSSDGEVVRADQGSSAVIIAVLDILNTETLEGRVLDDGSVSFLLHYEAIVFKLHRGEVVDLMVATVEREGWWGDVMGVGKMYISRGQMGSEWVYESDGVEGIWITKDGSRSVKAGEIVRVRVVAETPQSEGVVAIGSMIGKYLGPL